MCGIAGFIDFVRAPYTNGADPLRDIATGMATTLTHRGPDDAGVWVDPEAGVGLGHRRLSIVDLSMAGHQPMLSHDERKVIVYNGEVYNHRELRRDLAARGHAFRGQCDTEVILAAVDAWGVPGALDRVNGMFAFALWDRAERSLTLARDRFGEKPLYYGRAGGSLVFGSEMKALRAHPRFEGRVDRASLTQFLRFAYVPSPRSIFAGVRKLPPGTWLCVRTAADVDRPPTRYWSLGDVVRRAKGDLFAGSEDEAVDELDRLLRDSVARRMVSDVPLGAFLSGGIDSSTVVALMQAESTRPVRTFTIGFREPGYDEAETARAVARHLKTDHTELYVTPEEAQAVIPRLPFLYDEPFADSSQIPTFLVAQLARKQVTVALSGDGGDELFGGYTRYFWAENVWKAIRSLPPAAGRAVGAVLGRVSPGTWDSLFALAGDRLPLALRQRMPGDKLQKVAELLGAADPHDVYLRLTSSWKQPERVVLGGVDGAALLTREAEALGLESFRDQMMFADTVSYLPDDILAKVDRATMGVSLEGRIPLLDPGLAEFAWRLPTAMKVSSGKGKRPLRRLLARYVPPELFERPKMGFGVPIDAWLRGALRPWVEELLGERRLRDGGFFEPALVRKTWEEHLGGQRNHQHRLWNVLMFQAWVSASRAEFPE